MKVQQILILENYTESRVGKYEYISIALKDVDMVTFSEFGEILITMKCGRKLFNRNVDKSEYWRIIKMWNEYVRNGN